MKICDVVKNSVWYDPRVRKQVLSYQNIKDCEVSVVGLKDLAYNTEKLERFPCKIQLVNIDKKYFSKNRTLLMKIKRELITNRKMVQAIIDNSPDIIHANDLNALIPAFKAAKKLKCKLIYDSHEVFVENLEISKRKFIKLIWMAYEKFLIKHIDEMVCVSNAAAEYFIKTYSVNKPIVVTNCSLISEQQFYSEKNDGFEILNHGQFYEGRGYDTMIEAIPYLVDYPEIKLALRGFGRLEENLRTRVKELGTAAACFYPRVLVEELIPLASKSHVGVAITEPICLNFKLSISNKIFEYAAAGLPVIMSDIPEHRYLNEKYNFGIVLSDNRPETFARAVIKLYLDKEFYKECAQNARRLSMEINWENEFGELINRERQLIKGA